ncbi:hypothetical protein [Parasitella parasitica]|uniref:Kelch repeat protein n=1 Tax=Parasitella parasitica TaxID=35722 RepID=A0A0B7NGN0_9FUNG|nr:hypothetical protein [Parasitella parasitica]
MSGKLYCYGGSSFTSPTESQVDTTMLRLDISQKNGIHVNDLQNMWENVEYNANGVRLTPRTYPQCLVVTEQNRMIINGGYDTAVGQRLQNINIIYDAAQNKWIPSKDYFEIYWGYRQIYHGSASYVPGINALFTLQDAWKKPTTLTNAYDQFSAKHQSVFDPFSNMLLFMGGEYRVNGYEASPDPLLRPYDRIKAFNTETNVWSYINLTGDVPAPGRLHSTLTLLPSTNQHAMLFGGELNDKVESNYCFILNLYNKTWTKQTISAPNGTILARSRHSAVSIDKNTVLIMWGIDSSNAGTRSMLILDTTDPYSIKLLSTYDSSKEMLQPFVVQGISDGVKAGIAVAGAAVLVSVALFIWLYVRRKKRDRKMREQEREIAKQEHETEYFNRGDVEPMEVDWDEIDNKCTEMPTRNATYPEDDADHVVGSETSTTLVSRIETPSAPTEVILPDGIEIHQPNALDSPRQPAVLKPDGGH